jgi:hypothetical protein
MGQHQRAGAVAVEHAARLRQPFDDARCRPGRGAAVGTDADDAVLHCQVRRDVQRHAVEERAAAAPGGEDLVASGAAMAPATVAPPARTAIETHHCGRPSRNGLVPSMGAITQV